MNKTCLKTYFELHFYFTACARQFVLIHLAFISKVITVIRFGIDLVFGLIFHAVREDGPLEIQNHQGSCQKAR